MSVNGSLSPLAIANYGFGLEIFGDISEARSPNDPTFIEIDAAQSPRALDDVDAAAINTNTHISN